MVLLFPTSPLCPDGCPFGIGLLCPVMPCVVRSGSRRRPSASKHSFCSIKQNTKHRAVFFSGHFIGHHKPEVFLCCLRLVGHLMLWIYVVWHEEILRKGSTKLSGLLWWTSSVQVTCFQWRNWTDTKLLPSEPVNLTIYIYIIHYI